MLDKEQRIAVWRQTLAEAIGFQPTILDELENHLREEIDRQLQQGQSLDHAITSAIARFGEPDKLALEFAKLTEPWWPIRIVLVGVLLFTGCILTGIVVKGVQKPWDGLLIAHVAGVTAGYLLTYGAGILALCYAVRRIVRELSAGQRTSWSRALTGMSVAAFGFTFTGMVLGGIWANLQPQFGQFWNGDPREISGLIVLGWQAIFLLSLWQFQRASRWLMCWGALGNLAVTYAWLVTALSSPLTDRTGLLLGCLAMVLVHVAILGGALAPSGWLVSRKKTA